MEELLSSKDPQVRESAIERIVALGSEYVPALCNIMTDSNRKHYTRENAASAIYLMGRPGLVEMLAMQKEAFKGRGKYVAGTFNEYIYYPGEQSLRDIEDNMLSIAKEKGRSSEMAALYLGGRYLPGYWEKQKNKSRHPNAWDTGAGESKSLCKKKYGEIRSIVREILCDKSKTWSWPLLFYVHLATIYTNDIPQANEDLFVKAVSGKDIIVRQSALSYLRKHTELCLPSWSSFKSEFLKILSREDRTYFEKYMVKDILLEVWPELKSQVKSALKISELEAVLGNDNSLKALDAAIKLRIYGVSDQSYKYYFPLFEKWFNSKNRLVRRRALWLVTGGNLDGDYMYVIFMGFPEGKEERGSKLVFEALWDPDPVIRRLAGKLAGGGENVPDEEYWEDHDPEQCRKTVEKFKDAIMQELTR